VKPAKVFPSPVFRPVPDLYWPVTGILPFSTADQTFLEITTMEYHKIPVNSSFGKATRLVGERKWIMFVSKRDDNMFSGLVLSC
jgi:hypothetical protein